jgi:hypothetical protein
MDLNVASRQPIKGTVGSVEPSPLWLDGPAAAVDSPLAESEGRPYSYVAACECPDDCLRDHANE